jgi:hypothetical protein
VNPILRGFNPDPSLIRVGDDYYLSPFIGAFLHIFCYILDSLNVIMLQMQHIWGSIVLLIMLNLQQNKWFKELNYERNPS